jgi:Carboxypeptidase regulatory-like domain
LISPRRALQYAGATPITSFPVAFPMRRSLFFPVVCSLLLPLSLAAQRNAPAALEVHGHVKDAATGAPVAGALVQLRDTRHRAVSDSAGNFVLHRVAPGSYPWVISRLGYARWEEDAEVADGDEFTVALLARPEALEGITAVASQMEHRRLTSGVSVRTLERTTLRLTAAPSVLDLVHDHLDVAGVHCPPWLTEIDTRAPANSGGKFLNRNSYTRVATINDDPGDRSCAWVRGGLIKPAVYVDEQRVNGGLSDLASYRAQDLYTIESYDGGRMIRVVTMPYAERVARGRAALMPLSF